jgi:hypothetical protein
MLATRESFEVPQEIWCTGFVLDSVAEALKLLDLLVVALFRARSSGVLRRRFLALGNSRREIVAWAEQNAQSRGFPINAYQ